VFEQLYLDCQDKKLSVINYKFIQCINNILSIDTKIRQSSEFELSKGKSERLLSLCKQTEATEYISGPAAKDYLDEALFARNGVKIRWMKYDNYTVYRQLFGEFEHGVSILDLIFNEGHHCHEYMNSFKVSK
jgi:hypothetical protein